MSMTPATGDQKGDTQGDPRPRGTPDGRPSSKSRDASPPATSLGWRSLAEDFPQEWWAQTEETENWPKHDRFTGPHDEYPELETPTSRAAREAGLPPP